MKVLLLFILFIFSEIIYAQDLVIYKFSPRIPGNNDEDAGLINITFYPDGLIKSYKESYHQSDSEQRQTTEEFIVIRKGNTIRQEYLKNNENYKPVAFQLNNDVILVY